MSDSQPDKVTAFLDDAQRRYEVFGESGAMPRLLAAVEAALKLADEWLATPEPEYSSGMSPDEATGYEMVHETATGSGSKLREVISRALLGAGE